jgi:tetratricopeptide (TPR) repeat protein
MTLSPFRAGLCIAASLFLAGCSLPAVKPVGQAPANDPPASDANAVQQEEPRRPAPPKQALTQQLLYETLLAEIALQRGDKQLATRAYLDLVARTRDYRFAERATQVALQSGLIDEALAAAERWLALEPESTLARQTVAAILVSKGRLESARPHLERLLAAEGTNLPLGFMHLNNLLSRHPDKAAVLDLVQSLAKPYPEVPEAHFAVARAAWSAGQTETALAEIRAALALRPDWEGAALFAAQILAARSPAEAANWYRDFLAKHPTAREMRLAYARFLVQQKDYAAARSEFQNLVRDFPDNPEVPLAVGLISLEMRDFEVAERYLQRALEQGVKNGDLVRLYLGQIAEERKNYEEARRWYQEVGGEHAFTARLRLAALLAKEGRLNEARRFLSDTIPDNNQQRVQLWQAEAQLLREAKRYQEAFDVLTRALAKLPNHPDLLYDQAMAAEKIGRLDVLEASLRKLIQLKPDHAHAYNALGYTLADRTNRLEEARQLLEKALKLAPDDPFILDSMGWLYYRLKDYPKALDYLRRALAGRADPEIAAHLGEVLWVSGDRREAERVWNEALRNNPDHEVLLGVIQKFRDP